MTGVVSDGQCLLGIIDPEKVGIQYRLQYPCYPRNWIYISLSEISVQPIRYIQCSVYAKGEQIMGRDRLSLTGPLQHEELR